MEELIAQATGGLDAKWIIGGLASAFLMFGTWVGKFLKQIWMDVKVIWSEFKKMHQDQLETLKSVIAKNDAETEKIKDKADSLLAETGKIKKIVEDTKFSIDSIEKRLNK